MQRQIVAALVMAAVGAVLLVGFALREPTPGPLPVPEDAESQAARHRIVSRIQIQPTGESTPNPEEAEPKWRRVEDYPVESASTWAWNRWVLRDPEEFPGVPDPIRQALRARACRIPQSSDTTRPHNLLWGEFDHKGQRDLVVLCAEPGRTIVYIFWGGDVDQRSVAPFSGGRTDSALTIATAAAVEAHANSRARVDAEMPQALAHDIIEVSCCECCSSYYYRHRGRWFRAPGAD